MGMATSGQAHFGALIPTDDVIGQEDSKKLELAVKFIHPMERHYMEMARPIQFGVQQSGRKTDQLATLSEAKGKAPEQDRDFTAWRTTYQIKRPGDHTFYVEPAPYWEPAEDLFIIHYTKVCVNALGLEEGWDQTVGLETEIIPLTRPYGLWTNNLFTGRVLVKGKPQAGAEVEVEYLNESPDNPSQVKAPSDPYVTQVVRAARSWVQTGRPAARKLFNDSLVKSGRRCSVASSVMAMSCRSSTWSPIRVTTCAASLAGRTATPIGRTATE
jgi:cobalt/nickel transport protein